MEGRRRILGSCGNDFLPGYTRYTAALTGPDAVDVRRVTSVTMDLLHCGLRWLAANLHGGRPDPLCGVAVPLFLLLGLFPVPFPLLLVPTGYLLHRRWPSKRPRTGGPSRCSRNLYRRDRTLVGERGGMLRGGCCSSPGSDLRGEFLGQSDSPSSPAVSSPFLTHLAFRPDKDKQQGKHRLDLLERTGVDLCSSDPTSGLHLSG